MRLRSGVKALRHLGAEGAESADLAGDLGAHHTLQSQLGGQRGEVAQQAVLLLRGRAVDDVVALIEHGQQLGDFLGRMLKIIVHGDDDGVLRSADAAQQRVVLAVVAHQVDGMNPRMLRWQAGR